MCSLLFILLGLELMGLLIIFIYVGAISILFLFIIMFIEVRYLESKPRVKVLSIQQTITILFMWVILSLVLCLDTGVEFIINTYRLLSLSLGYSFEGISSIVSQLGILIYTEYSLGVTLSGILLLVAMVSAIIISSLL